MTNPYSWNKVNLDAVFGRDKLTGELLSGLVAPQGVSFALTGGRRMGKTTVFRRVQKELDESTPLWAEQGITVVAIYVDGLSFPRPITADAIWAFIYYEMAGALGAHVRDDAALTFADFVGVTKQLLARSANAVKVVVLFDEIEPLLVEPWSVGFFANWRALLSNTPGVSAAFTAVFSGARELISLRQDVGSPLMDILEFRSLRNLMRREVAALMNLSRSEGWGADVEAAVFDESGGQPMLVQYLMQGMVNLSDAMPPLNGLAATSESFLKTRAWQFSDWWYKYCSPAAQRVYLALPKDGGEVGLRELVTQFGVRQTNDALEILRHVGVANSSEDEMSFSRAGTLFSRWQAEYGQIVNTAAHDPKIYESLNLVDPEFGKKYASAWSILNTDHQNYSGAVSEMRDTITLLLHSVAPDASVIAMEGFSLEAGQARPTRRQRAKYAIKQKSSGKGLSKSLPSDIEMLAAQADHFAAAVASTYGVTSGLTHTVSSSELAYQALKQGDSILAQLLG